MLQIICEFCKIMAAVMLCAAAVKLTDDYLDKDIDIGQSRINWAEAIGPGAMVYAILFMLVAVSISCNICAPLFFASYIAGMFQDLTKEYPTLLKGWQECLAVFLLGIFLFDILNMVFSILIVAAVQLIDDCVDIKTDKFAGCRNLAQRFGMTLCMLLAVINLMLAYWLQQTIFWPVFIGITTIYILTLIPRRELL